MRSWFILVYLTSLAGTGCAAVELRPGAESIIVSRHNVPEGCQFRGMVQGEQGGALSGPLTSNANLAQGAMNDLRNKALDLGANYLVLEDSRAGQTISGDNNSISGQQTDVTHMANAYYCPPERVGLASNQ